MNRRNLTKTQLRCAIALYRIGKTDFAAISKVLGIAIDVLERSRGTICSIPPASPKRVRQPRILDPVLNIPAWLDRPKQPKNTRLIPVPEIRALYDASETLDAIGRRAGVSRERIRQIAKSNGWSRPVRYRRPNAALIEERAARAREREAARVEKKRLRREAIEERYRQANELWKQGMPMHDIARQLKVAEPTLWIGVRDCRTRGAEWFPPRSTAADMLGSLAISEALRLYDAGETLATITSQAGLRCKKSVMVRIRKHRLPRNRVGLIPRKEIIRQFQSEITISELATRSGLHLSRIKRLVGPYLSKKEKAAAARALVEKRVATIRQRLVKTWSHANVLWLAERPAKDIAAMAGVRLVKLYQGINACRRRLGDDWFPMRRPPRARSLRVIRR